MTGKQIRAARASLPSRCRVPYKEWTDEQKRLDKELSCREMMNSCLAYGGMKDFWRRHDSLFAPGEVNCGYADRHVEELGLKRVRELEREQEEDFAKAKLRRNTYTDSEGVTYNTIIWGDE